MNRELIMTKNPGDWSEEEQLFMIEQSDNSLFDKDDPEDQPPQDPDYQPDPDEVVDKL